MADKLTEDQVAGLLAVLRKDAPIDTKVQEVTIIKSAIKQHNVPDTCAAPLFEALRLASSSQHSSLVNVGFTSLNHLLTRLSRQEPKLLLRETKHTLPLIVDKMGDQKDKFRGLALQAMVTLYAHAPTDVDRFIRNTALTGKNPRAKETGMQWLLQMHQETGLQFRPYVPILMELLEDADGMVRDAAKSTVLSLFKDAPNAAKSDLKRQLKNFKVRPAIEAAIVKELAPSGPVKRDIAESRPGSAMSTRPANLGASVSSLSSERPFTPSIDTRAETVEPHFVNTQRELDEIIKEMPWHFEGRETEQNWMKREESITKLRKLNAGNAASDFPDAFVAGCRSLLDGIIKAVISLRTSLSKEGCALIQDLAHTFGPGIDPMVELLMQTLIKLSAGTKKLIAGLADTTVEAIISHVTYTNRIMQHVSSATQDKNVQPRTFATGWLKTLIKKEANTKHHIEHGNGLDMLQKAIKRGLADPNPGVREKMRGTYWAFSEVWPVQAEAIMESLDGTAQKLLRKDPNNPDSSQRGAGPPAKPGLGLSKSTMGSKPSLRETMMAQKRAAAAPKNMPARPGSAMATITTARTGSNASSNLSSTSSGTSSQATTHTTTRARPDTSNLAHGGMSVAPMRPARRRPEVAARPATAGPYSVRSHDGPSGERGSPPDLKSKTATPKAISGSPRRTVPRTRPGHAATASESSVATPPKPTPKSASKPTAKPTATASPRHSPLKPKRPISGAAGGSPPKPRTGASTSRPPTRNETKSNPPQNVEPDMEPIQRAPEVEIPISTSPHGSPQAPSPAVNNEPNTNGNAAMDVDEPVASPAKSLKVYEDPFVEGQDNNKPPSNDVASERPVLEDRPVNEDAANLTRVGEPGVTAPPPFGALSSPEKNRQNSRLLESAMARVRAQSLDVHGFRKLQSIIRDGKLLTNDDKFDSLLLGLYEYLESPLESLAPEKVQDVKAQVLGTIKLLLKKSRESFQPHITRGLEALLVARSRYDARTHIVSGLELLADELVSIGDADEITVVVTQRVKNMEIDVSGNRSLSMGLHVLKEVIEAHASFVPNEGEVESLASLTSQCLESKDSGVRMDAVQLCVALHSRVGEAKFWESLKGVKDDPKSLITYYVVKKQREMSSSQMRVSG